MVAICKCFCYTLSMKDRRPASCPLVFSLEIFGDKWSLVILRDVLFTGKSHFREFLASEEKIATNILSARLATLVAEGMLTREDDPSHKNGAIYKPTKKALDFVPALIAIMQWGAAYNPAIDVAVADIDKIINKPDQLHSETLAKFANVR